MARDRLLIPKAIPLTFERLSIIISEEPQRIRSYYLSIVQEPPEPHAKIYTQYTESDHIV